MPIIKPIKYPDLFYPKRDYEVARYMDVIKFISMLQKRALFFCKVGELEDKFEGGTSRVNEMSREAMYKDARDTGFFDEEEMMTDKKIKLESKEHYDFLQTQHRLFSTVSCWNKFFEESAALWKIYAELGKGIMIKSSISRLRKALQNTMQGIHLCEVQYYNPRQHRIPENHELYSIIYKLEAYHYEEEIRLIYKFEEKDNKEIYEWLNQEVKKGIYLSVNVKNLIEEIVLGPKAENWNKRMIEDILEKYKVKKPVKYSTLNPLHKA